MTTPEMDLVSLYAGDRDAPARTASLPRTSPAKSEGVPRPLITESDVLQAVRRTIEDAMRADGTPELFARFGAEDAAPAVLDCLSDLGVLRVPAP